MITEYQRNAVRFDGDRPVAAGDQPLTQPTRVVRTGAGFWGLYVAGDEVVVVHPTGALRGRAGDIRERLEGMVRDGAAGAGSGGLAEDDRQAAASFLPFLGGDDPGAARDAPRSRVEEGVPPTYWVSGVANTPPGAEPETRIEEAQPGPDAG